MPAVHAPDSDVFALPGQVSTKTSPKTSNGTARAGCAEGCSRDGKTMKSFSLFLWVIWRVLTETFARPFSTSEIKLPGRNGQKASSS